MRSQNNNRTEFQSEKPLCVHCGKRRANRPRGLCWTHYRQPEIRARYGRKKFGHHTAQEREPTYREVQALLREARRKGFLKS